MRSAKVLLVTALGASMALSGCSLKYRMSPNENTVIMVANNASASVKGHFTQSEGLVHWPPSYFWGENPVLWGSDVLGRVASNKAVSNVKVSTDLNGFLAYLKSVVAWGGGLGYFYISGIAPLFAGQSFDFGKFVFAFIGWSVVQGILTFLLPDFYSVSVDGDYVDPPANLGKGGPATAAH
jgi:hypothetical protein